MTATPEAEHPISTPASTSRKIWVEPEIEALAIEQTEFLFGVGLDGNPGNAPDCTHS